MVDLMIINNRWINHQKKMIRWMLKEKTVKKNAEP